jgi:UDP-N-acetylglucosamine 2-epimerase
VHGRNVIHSDCERAAIAMAARKAIAPAFRRSLRGLPNPYGDGRAAGRIVRVLERSKLDRRLLMKRFYDADS